MSSEVFIARKRALVHQLAGLDPETNRRILDVLRWRTRYLTVVLEDLYQPHNGAAVIRACECFGVQDVYIIPRRNIFQISEEVASNASRWIKLHQPEHPDPEHTHLRLKSLKRRGYRIVATTLREDCIPLAELPLDEKIAICFGTEEQGLSEQAHELADLYMRIPMYGFTQSYNISVSAAITLFELTERIHASKVSWQLDEEEKLDLQIQWLAQSIPSARERVLDFATRYGIDPHSVWLPKNGPANGSQPTF